MKRNELLLSGVLILALLCPTAPSARAADADPARVSITAYAVGQALITEERTLDLPPEGEAPFPGAPASIDVTSVALRSLDEPGKVRVDALRLLPSAADPGAVLRNYVGREVRVVLPDPADARARITRKATLLSAGDRAVLDLGGEIYVGPLEAVLLPGGADRPRAESVLLLDVRNQGRSRQRVEIAYLAGGLSWSGDCALNLDADGERGGLSCWATVRNDTGRTFRDAQLRLVAGDVRREAPVALTRAKAAGVMMLEANVDMSASVQQAGEYHVFTVPRPATLTEGQITRLALCAADGVRVGRELTVRGNALRRAGGAEPERVPVENVLVLRNTAEDGLGVPLPASQVRVYRALSDGGRMLEGEASLANLPAGETARLTLGTAFDVTARRSMRSYERINKDRVRVGWRVELRNAGNAARTVHLRETFQGDWKIARESAKHAKLSADTAGWTLEVPSGSAPVVLDYEAEIAL